MVKGLKTQVYRTDGPETKRQGPRFRGSTPAHNLLALRPDKESYDPEVPECINNKRGTSLLASQKSAYIGTMTVSKTPKGPARLLARGAAGLVAAVILLGSAYAAGTGDPSAALIVTLSGMARKVFGS